MIIENDVIKKIKSCRDDMFYYYAAPAELVHFCDSVTSSIISLLRSLNEIQSRRDYTFIEFMFRENSSTPSDSVCHLSMRGIFEIIGLNNQ